MECCSLPSDHDGFSVGSICGRFSAAKRHHHQPHRKEDDGEQEEGETGEKNQVSSPEGRNRNESRPPVYSRRFAKRTGIKIGKTVRTWAEPCGRSR
jgi:hypothetical protein